MDIEKRTNNVVSLKLEEKHFSKSSIALIDKEDKLNMINGTKLHEIFEREDFNSSTNSYVLKFLAHPLFKDIKKAKIYKEYEFRYSCDNTNYHGIIDLLLVFDDYALIIDYKMYHVLDDAYKLQLDGYKKYVENKLNIPVRTYLYAIYPDLLEEIK